MQKLKILFAVFLLVILGTGCAGTMSAIQNREMSLSAKMSDTIFLNPEILAKNRNIYVRVTNTSDYQQIDFADILRHNLQAKGFTITNQPADAGYIIQANLLYLGKEKKDLTADGMAVGGFGGALAGSTIGGDWRGNAAGGLAGGIAGAVIGGIIGSAIHVDTFFGALDIQIKEASDVAVQGKMNSDIKQGSSTTMHTEKAVNSNFQEYRTRIVVKAVQTNIDKNEACNAIANRLATQIAGMF